VTGVNAHGCETYQGEKISSFDLTIRMITQGIVNLDGFITHRFPLKDYREAFRRIHSGREKIIKAVLVSE
jgi:L-iditol 2-dehydrogenase